MNNNLKNSIDIDQFTDSISTGNLKICVIGVGRIGLPTALSFAKSGLPTMGVDINSDLVSKINSNDYPLKDEPGYDVIFDQVITNKKFHASTKIEDVVPNSNVILLSLPTPMNNHNIPDYSALKSVAKQLGDLLEFNSLVVVESTIEPGFVENELIQIIESGKKHLIAGENFFIGVCPETANPGEIMNDFTKLPRLVGAIDEVMVDKSAFEDTIYSIRRHKKFHFWMKTGLMKLSTIHSFKGWEAPTLFLVLDETGDFTSPELVYAGLTRCRFRLIIINRHNNALHKFFTEHIGLAN